jgi:NifU-like protein
VKFYPAKINEKFERPQNIGVAAGANAVGTSASFACGTFVKLFLRIEKDSKQIVEAKFKTSGCGFMIAAAETLCEKIKGRKLVELHGLDKSVLQREIERELEKFPENRAHCLEVCLESLQAAFAGFRRFQIEESAGEKVLICTCFGVSEDTIEGLIEKKSLKTVEEISENCNAGGGCGSCQPLIQEILDVYWRENF